MNAPQQQLHQSFINAHNVQSFLVCDFHTKKSLITNQHSAIVVFSYSQIDGFLRFFFVFVTHQTIDSLKCIFHSSSAAKHTFWRLRWYNKDETFNSLRFFAPSGWCAWNMNVCVRQANKVHRIMRKNGANCPELYIAIVSNPTTHETHTTAKWHVRSYRAHIVSIWISSFRTHPEASSSSQQQQ